MKHSMLEYLKMVLQKVSFDRGLLRREYRKSFQWLNASERKELNLWIKQKDLFKESF